MTDRPIIGITMGDPVGIGPEIVLKALSDPSLYETCRPLVLGDIGVLQATARCLGTPLSLRGVHHPEAGSYGHGVVDVLELSDLDPGHLEPGNPSPATGRAMVEYITHGIDLAMAGRIHGLATGPINKAAMHKVGVPFEGHTEILAQRTNTADYVMMLAGTRLRVALVTIHVPVAQVSQRLSTDAIARTIRITHEALRDSFGIPRPRLAVAALNPHAGEGGAFGNEETEIIVPGIRLAQQSGVDVDGPYPADTLFHRALKGTWDAIIAMYHDQGLIPFKMIHFSDGVNTTLGLPIVRTSVDHGTAYDIAGKGRADPGSLMAAIEMAAHQARQKAKSAGHRA